MSSNFDLTPLTRKLALFEELGLDVAFVEPFNAELAAIPAQGFIERVLVAGLGVGHVVIGYDFYFGNKRGGNPELMVRAGEELGFGVTVMPPVAENGEVFSSSAVRLHLAQGDVKRAAHMLGEPWRVRGRVVGGAKRGTDLGFPTANIPLPKGTTLGHGIYAVRVHFSGTVHDGAAYLGTRPTFDDGMPVLEVFLFDFTAIFMAATSKSSSSTSSAATVDLARSRSWLRRWTRDIAKARATSGVGLDASAASGRDFAWNALGSC